jgi:hypothetical protein
MPLWPFKNKGASAMAAYRLEVLAIVVAQENLRRLYVG